MLGMTFTVVRPDCDESLPPESPPSESVRLLAVRKAETVAALRSPQDCVIAADTLVCLDGRLLGKPCDQDDAFSILRSLSGRAHEVYTGLAVCRDGVTRAETQMTRVWFRPMDDHEIWTYVRSGVPMDKAGAYGIQDRGALFVSHIEGDFYNVMGLPLCLLGRMIDDLS